MLSGFSSSTTLTMMLIRAEEQTVLEQIHGGFMVGLDACQYLGARSAIFRARDHQINSPSSISPAVVHHWHCMSARYNNLLPALLGCFCSHTFPSSATVGSTHHPVFHRKNFLTAFCAISLRFTSSSSFSISLTSV